MLNSTPSPTHTATTICSSPPACHIQQIHPVSRQPHTLTLGIDCVPGCVIDVNLTCSQHDKHETRVLSADKCHAAITYGTSPHSDDHSETCEPATESPCPGNADLDWRAATLSQQERALQAERALLAHERATFEADRDKFKAVKTAFSKCGRVWADVNDPTKILHMVLDGSGSSSQLAEMQRKIQSLTHQVAYEQQRVAHWSQTYLQLQQKQQAQPTAELGPYITRINQLELEKQALQINHDELEIYNDTLQLMYDTLHPAHLKLEEKHATLQAWYEQTVISKGRLQCRLKELLERKDERTVGEGLLRGMRWLEAESQRIAARQAAEDAVAQEIMEEAEEEGADEGGLMVVE